jgi:hypothetical protein
VYAAIRFSRYRRESHLETVAGFTDYGGKLVVEVGCGIGIDGSSFALLAWPWFNPVATQAVFTRFAGDYVVGRAPWPIDERRVPVHRLRRWCPRASGRLRSSPADGGAGA